MIPISNSIIKQEFRSSLFYYMVAVHWGTEKLITCLNGNKYINLTLNDVPWNTFMASAKTAQKFKRELQLQMKDSRNLFIADDFFALVPETTFEKWYNFMATQSSRSRNSYTTLYFYIYLKCMQSLSGWSHSVQQIAAELSMQPSLVSKKIQELQREGFLERSNFIFGDVNLATTYIIPLSLATVEKQWEEKNLTKIKKVIDKSENICYNKYIK